MLVVSTIWYFDLLPDIELVAANQPVPSLQGENRQPTLLIATIATPNSLAGEDVRGYLQIFSPDGEFNSSVNVAASREFPVREPGNELIVINNLSPANYAAVTYLDLNDNAQLDFDDQGVPQEPYLIARTETADGKEETSSPGFFLRPGLPVTLQFNFKFLEGQNKASLMKRSNLN